MVFANIEPIAPAVASERGVAIRIKKLEFVRGENFT